MSGGALRLRAELGRLGAWPEACEERPRVDSTNAELRRLARAGAPPWSVLTALEQSAGRGRHGRHWHSPPGNLYLSVLLPPPADLARATLLPLLGGLACAEALDVFGVAACLKWPNDVLDPATERKLAGVLVEGAAVSGGLEHLVLGVGVNLIEDRATLPAGLRDRLGTARAASGDAPERLALAARLLTTLRRRHAEAELDAGQALRQGWRARSIGWWGRRVRVESGGERIEGIARGISEQGALVLELPGGERREVLSGEARELRSSGANRG
jgi:BirA family biotin operon repressor/biotin-[acetyl-CoA-carboxylase] ligase